MARQQMAEKRAGYFSSSAGKSVCFVQTRLCVRSRTPIRFALFIDKQPLRTLQQRWPGGAAAVEPPPADSVHFPCVTQTVFRYAVDMATARFRFYEELNDFLPPAQRKVEFGHDFTRRTSVKDMIESFGVPHTEIEIILVNGCSVDFSYIVKDGDRVSVYPVFESFDISPLLRLRPTPLRHPRFVIDTNLGRLARYLRLLGFDCLYENDFSDAKVAAISEQDQRIVLTRDRRLLQRRIIDRGYFVRETDPKAQVHEVIERMDLYTLAQPFSRCTRCNGLLEDVPKSAVEHLLQPKTRRYYERFRQCPQCGQVYWQGSHEDRARSMVERFLGTTDHPERKI